MFLMYENDPDSKHYLGDVVLCPEEQMVPRVNGALGLLDVAVGGWEDYDYVGWIADDNRFETKGWDVQVKEALQSHPLVFCNDVVSPGSKPSHVFMDARIPRALGWLMLPGLHSTFFDDVWANLGVGPIDVGGPLFPTRPNLRGATHFVVNHRGLGISYLDDVRVNHLYIEKDNAAWFQKDHETYRRWLRHDAEADIQKAKAALRKKVAA